MWYRLQMWSELCLQIVSLLQIIKETPIKKKGPRHLVTYAPSTKTKDSCPIQRYDVMLIIYSYCSFISFFINTLLLNKKPT